MTFRNSGDRPGGGDGVLDLDSGIFTCLTPGFYEVSFSAYGEVGPTDENQQSLYLYKNDNRVDERLSLKATGPGSLGQVKPNMLGSLTLVFW